MIGSQMDYEQIVAQAVSGQITMNAFLDKLQADSGLQQYVRALIPASVQASPNHPAWERCYEAHKALNFDVIRVLDYVNGFQRSFGGNLNAYDTLSWAFCLTHPDAKRTTIYDELFDLYLDAVQDCFEGPEVELLVDHLLKELLSIRPKTKRTQAAKEAVRALFHVEGQTRPHWIQGPEWPMGKNSPMKYLSRKRDGERVIFTFQDVDTGEIREVEQFY